MTVPTVTTTEPELSIIGPKAMVYFYFSDSPTIIFRTLVFSIGRSMSTAHSYSNSCCVCSDTFYACYWYVCYIHKNKQNVQSKSDCCTHQASAAYQKTTLNNQLNLIPANTLFHKLFFNYNLLILPLFFLLNTLLLIFQRFQFNKSIFKLHELWLLSFKHS